MESIRSLGRRVYGLGAITLGLVGLAWGDFALQWQPVSQHLPGRTALAYAVAAALVAAGAALNWRRSAATAALGLAALFGFGVILLHLPLLAAHPAVPASWLGVAEQAALVAGGLAAWASLANLETRRALQAPRIARVAFGLCLLVFGSAHFFYASVTASMVPAWLPPGRLFWAYATGAAHVAAGLAILSGVQARLAAILVVVMFAGFGLLVHAPLLFADPHSHLAWVSNAMNLALTGAAWAVAHGIAGSGRRLGDGWRGQHRTGS